jgi:hypothetical protein
VTPNKILKKLSSKLCQEKHNKELRKSPQRRTGKAPHNLEEPRRIIYTYQEGSYKVQLATRTSIPLSRSHMKLPIFVDLVELCGRGEVPSNGVLGRLVWMKG